MINDLGDLRKLIALCRKQGITDIELGALKIKFGELPSEGQPAQVVETENQYAGFPDGILTPTQLAFYSAGGLPEDDPEIEAAR